MVFYVSKFMDRVTVALDEIRKKNKKHETNISPSVHGKNKLVQLSIYLCLSGRFRELFTVIKGKLISS